MSKKRQHKTYTQEFKEEVDALVTEQGYSVSDAAISLAVRTNQLYSWKQKQVTDKGDHLLNTEEKSDLLALHKKVKQLGMEKEILLVAL